MQSCDHGGVAKNLTVRRDDDLAADAEAGERRRRDPAFRARVRQIIEQGRECLSGSRSERRVPRPGRLSSDRGRSHRDERRDDRARRQAGPRRFRADAPAAGFGDTEFHLELIDKPAVLIVRLVKNHPLPDGDKRAASVALRPFLEMSGWAGEQCRASMRMNVVLGIASGTWDVECPRRR